MIQWSNIQLSKYSKELDKVAKKASRAEIKKSFEQNISIVAQHGDKIYRIFANGKKEEIKQIQNSYIKIDKKKISLNLK